MADTRTGARGWPTGIFALPAFWIAFAVLALGWPGTLGDAWDWIRGLPLAAEIVVWIVTLPFTLALAVLESSWPTWAQVLAVACLAVCLTGASSAPRERGGRHELRPRPLH